MRDFDELIRRVNCSTIQDIHETPGKGVVIITGGGFGALDLLMRRGGGSNTLLSAQVPYDTRETAQVLGYTPKNFAEPGVAEGLCTRAFAKAFSLVGYGHEPAFGVGVTASLAKGTPERVGRKHQFYIHGQDCYGLSVVAKWEMENTEVYGAIGGTDDLREHRQAEEEFLSWAVCDVISRLKTGKPLEDHRFQEGGYFRDRYEVTEVHIKHHYNGYCGSDIGQHLSGSDAYFRVTPDGVEWTQDPPVDDRGRGAVLPGSFNPFHEGHAKMYEVLEEMSGVPTALELSTLNVDKPEVSVLGLIRRLDSIADYAKAHGTTYNIKVTRSPRFLDKSLPGATFGVGLDTALRVVDPKYADLAEVKDQFYSDRVRFVVFPRELDGIQTAESAWRTMPWWFRDISFLVPGFSMDVSSTKIREGL